MKSRLILFSLLLPLGLAGQYSVSGRVEIDSSWENTIYLSLIPDQESMYLCSEQLIIAKSPVDREGRFTLKGNLFPDQSHLVRLHLSKRGDPPATLIIGGKEENHGFIALQPKAKLQLKPASTGLFDHFSVQDDPENRALYQVDSLVQYFATIDTAFSSISYKSMVQEKQAETLLTFADTCRFLLPALYAIHQSDWGLNQEQIQQAKIRLAERFPPHPYLDGFKSASAGNNSSFMVWGTLSICLLMIGGIVLMIRQRPPTSLKDLSVRNERS